MFNITGRSSLLVALVVGNRHRLMPNHFLFSRSFSLLSYSLSLRHPQNNLPKHQTRTAHLPRFRQKLRIAAVVPLLLLACTALLRCFQWKWGRRRRRRPPGILGKRRGGRGTFRERRWSSAGFAVAPRGCIPQGTLATSPSVDGVLRLHCGAELAAWAPRLIFCLANLTHPACATGIRTLVIVICCCCCCCRYIR